VRISFLIPPVNQIDSQSSSSRTLCVNKYMCVGATLAAGPIIFG
jgi:hypothetical protein